MITAIVLAAFALAHIGPLAWVAMKEWRRRW